MYLIYTIRHSKIGLIANLFRADYALDLTNSEEFTKISALRQTKKSLAIKPIFE